VAWVRRAVAGRWRCADTSRTAAPRGAHRAGGAGRESRAVRELWVLGPDPEAPMKAEAARRYRGSDDAATLDAGAARPRRRRPARARRRLPRPAELVVAPARLRARRGQE